MLLSLRLQSITDYILPTSKLIDVGTDHAQLLIYLMRNNMCEKVLGIDNKIGPIKIARANVSQHNLTHKIDLQLHDGFYIQTITDYNTVVIAGLGVKTITTLLQDDQPTIKRFVLLSTDIENKAIRNWAYKQGYYIEDEKIILDNKFYYELIVINKEQGAKLTNDHELYFGPVNLKLLTKNMQDK